MGCTGTCTGFQDEGQGRRKKRFHQDDVWLKQGVWDGFGCDQLGDLALKMLKAVGPPQFGLVSRKCLCRRLSKVLQQQQSLHDVQPVSLVSCIWVIFGSKMVTPKITQPPGGLPAILECLDLGMRQRRLPHLQCQIVVAIQSGWGKETIAQVLKPLD